MLKEKFIKTILYSLIGSASLTFAVIVALNIGSMQEVKNTFAQATTVKPETFTELYFENHTKLPTQLANQDNKFWYYYPTTNLYSFSFTIHNLENKDMVYPYEVYSISNDTTLIDENEVSIKNNESKTITEQFSLPAKYSTTKILVNLPSKDQQISFWMEGNIQ